MDPAIVERARGGDGEAFAAIVRDRMDAVYRLSLAILDDDADARDATQETFVAAWRQIRSLREVDRFDAWLQRIAVNRARMTLRGRRRRQVREIASDDVVRRSIAATDTGSASESDRRRQTSDDGERLGRAMARLTVDQRAILALHHLEGQGLADIAEVLQVPVGTVKSRLFTARRELQKALGTETGR